MTVEPRIRKPNKYLNCEHFTRTIHLSPHAGYTRIYDREEKCIQCHRIIEKEMVYVPFVLKGYKHEKRR